MKTIHLLAANDMPFFLGLLELCIGDKGAPIQLDQVINGKEVMEKIKKGNQYDAILMNLEMPIQDGWKTTKAVRELGISTPIIAWSVHEKKDAFSGCKAVGMNDYIEINSSRLLEDVLEALERVGVQVSEK